MPTEPVDERAFVHEAIKNVPLLHQDIDWEAKYHGSQDQIQGYVEEIEELCQQLIIFQDLNNRLKDEYFKLLLREPHE